MADVCEVTELDRACCAHCRGLPDPGREPMVTVDDPPPPGATVRAQWPGKCGGCGDPFPEGALIMRDPANTAWRADCCHEGDHDV